MDSNRFTAWCDTAVSFIKYQPDRLRVREELLAHMEDKFDALSATGMLPGDAEAEVLRAMGNAAEVAKELSKIHKPFLGYVLRITKWALIISIIAMLISLAGFSSRVYIGDDDVWGIFSREETENNYYTKRLYPNISASSDGYTFTVTRAAEIFYLHTTDDGTQNKGYSFHFTVTAFNPRPWAVHTDILREFYAIDSLGNYYYSSWEYGYTDEPAILGNPTRTGYFTTSHEMWLSNYVSHDAEWIELRYDRAGRNIVLHIDLTGGAEE